jgi:hypothetical protein
VFHRQTDLQAIYGNLLRTALHTVKPGDIATFLGKKLPGNYQDEMGNRYNVRLEGTRVRHSMGLASIKMYDKFGSTSSTRRTKLSFWLSLAESSLSAACRTGRCALGSPGTTAAQCPGSYLLQVLPDRARQAGHCPGFQAQGTGPHSETCCCPLLLIRDSANFGKNLTR